MPNQFDYKTALENNFNIKRDEDPDVFHGLEALASEFVLTKTIDAMGDNTVTKLNNSNVSEPQELVTFLQAEIPEFSKKFSTYFKDFLKEYGING